VNIVFLAAMYAPYVGGGAERVLRTQAEGLARRGHRVHVLTLGEPGSGVVHDEVDGVRMVRVAIRNFYHPGSAAPPSLARVAWHVRDAANPGMVRDAREQLAALRPDVVVCHNVFGWSAMVWRAVRALGVPLVQVLHDQYLRCVRSTLFDRHRCATPCLSCRIMRLPHRRWSRLPDAVVGASRFVLDAHVEAGYFRDVPVRTWIHNASHLDTRGQPARPRSGVDVVFGFIGTLAPNKGIEPLLATFRSQAASHWRLLVAGTGEVGFVERLRADHADGRIAFLGRQEAADFYLGLDATVVPSLWDDTLPSVVFESLIHGRPVIGSRRGGIPEMIDEGRSGLLYATEEPGALGRALASFAADLEGWRARQAAIKEQAASRYCDQDAWIARWETLLRQVIAAHR
jgi:glycosyltransferase involved in cell wall biosynthesis